MQLRPKSKEYARIKENGLPNVKLYYYSKIQPLAMRLLN